VRLVAATHTLERMGAEARLDAAPAAWRLLALEAAAVIDLLRVWRNGGSTVLACAS
jgi:hypothetical protein